MVSKNSNLNSQYVKFNLGVCNSFSLMFQPDALNKKNNFSMFISLYHLHQIPITVQLITQPHKY